MSKQAEQRKGQRVGYIRVSSFDQNPERQLDGVMLDRIFCDYASGGHADRPQLKALLDFVRDGDTVIVHSMDRLARNLNDLRHTVNQLNQKGIWIEFIKENMCFTGDDSPMSHLMLSIMGAFAEFERALIRERQREGIELAKQKGVYTGRKPALDAQQIALLCQRIQEGEKRSALAHEFGISRQTLYQYLRQYLKQQEA